MMTGNNNAAAKKLVIKPFSVAPKVSDNFFAETWQKLKQAVKTVYEKNASSIGKEELYRVSTKKPYYIHDVHVMY